VKVAPTSPLNVNVAVDELARLGGAEMIVGASGATVSIVNVVEAAGPVTLSPSTCRTLTV
jgi:hypothetical protein